MAIETINYSVYKTSSTVCPTAFNVLELIMSILSECLWWWALNLLWVFWSYSTILIVGIWIRVLIYKWSSMMGGVFFETKKLWVFA